MARGSDGGSQVAESSHKIGVNNFTFVSCFLPLCRRFASPQKLISSMSTIHIDETGGSDTTGTGAADHPYQSLGFALFTHGAASFLTRKDASGTYEEPTQSAVKKAKKTAEGLEKKRKKAVDLERAEAEEKEKREKILEQSKKIVLAEDTSLPKATKVRDGQNLLSRY